MPDARGLARPALPRARPARQPDRAGHGRPAARHRGGAARPGRRPHHDGGRDRARDRRHALAGGGGDRRRLGPGRHDGASRARRQLAASAAPDAWRRPWCRRSGSCRHDRSPLWPAPPWIWCSICSAPPSRWAPRRMLSVIELLLARALPLWSSSTRCVAPTSACRRATATPCSARRCTGGSATCTRPRRGSQHRAAAGARADAAGAPAPGGRPRGARRQVAGEPGRQGRAGRDPQLGLGLRRRRDRDRGPARAPGPARRAGPPGRA